MTTELYQQLINKFGTKNQCIVAIEELSELQKEICKQLRNIGNLENLAEEIADVEIMIEQLKIIYACDSLVADKKDYKINRIKERYLNNDYEFEEKFLYNEYTIRETIF